MNIEQARFNMIEQQIRPWKVLDHAVLELLAVVKREDFVPAAYRAAAFVDTELPLGEGQTMLTPPVEARLLQDAKVQRHETVLEVGTGSGYTTALLAHRARRVISLENRPALARMARENLARAGISNVEVRDADGRHGLAAEGPFDVIMLSGSVASVPQALLDQVKVGGRLVAIEGGEPVMRAVVYFRESASSVTKTEMFDTMAPRLDGFDDATRFRF
ncbi:MAG: protein-L-isoaspartate O-methyltransferase [Burkholderiales bacterium]|nr:protein-L-isoaspartate O-methyltransferase [Burkholderiales bacterium]